MEEYSALQKAAFSAKSGDQEAFETFFILTNAETYYLVHSMLRDENTAMQFLVRTYIEIYQDIDSMPSGEEEIYEKIREAVCKTVGEHPDLAEADLSRFQMEKGIKEKISDEKVATLWLQIGESIENGREKREESEKTGDYIISGLRIAVMLLVIGAAAAVIFYGWNTVKQSRDERGRQKLSDSRMETAGEVSEPLLQINDELPNPGWLQRRDESVTYIKRDQTEVNGSVALGKQIFTFDKEGELALIEENSAAGSTGTVSFYEDIRYEVLEGDLYRSDALTRERSCIVRNGHIVWADVRNLSVYYICEFKIPNSDKIKLSIYSASLDGEQETLIMESMEDINTSDLQITEQWMYHISDGILIRTKIPEGHQEIIAVSVENFFVLDDKNIYYMQDGSLFMSEGGSKYIDGKQEYYIEEKDDKLVLRDEFGNPVNGDENGRIQIGDRVYQTEHGAVQHVTAAERRYGDLVFYMNENINDKKLYWKRDTGAIGLLRQSGKWVDSFCIADSWLYYSAFMGTDHDGNPTSRIFRINLDDGQEETVTELFSGNVGNLYFFDETGEIYGEYVPNNKESMRGQVVVIPPGGSMSVINDKDVRPESTVEGNDTFEIVMLQDDKLYCLWHDCTWDRQTNELKSVNVKPIVLNSSSRTGAVSGEGE